VWILEKKNSIGKEFPVFLIAEVGVNHNGNIALAHKLIDAASLAGANGVKFQTFITEELVSPDTPLAGHHVVNVKEKISHYSLIKKLELSFDSFVELKSHCEQKNMVFISTPYDIPSAEFLSSLQVELIKVASSEMSNLPLLDVLRQSEIPIILSTGMSYWEEIVESVKFIKEIHSEICVLKCTSNYPASPESINLLGINKLKDKFPDLLVGFSDHTNGMEVSLAALAFGVSIIERHFTLDKEAWGPDHKASMLPDEFAAFTRAVRKVEKAFGIRNWCVQDEELAQRKTMNKGVFARRNIDTGEIVTISDVKFQRPEGGLTPKEFFLDYAGRPSQKPLMSGQLLTRFHFLNK
jgi:N,N'-diacetyllegionaminate synthase